VVALVFSVQSLQQSRATSQIQAELAQKQGSYLEVLAASVSLLDMGTNDWKEYKQWPTSPPVVIPLDEWQNSDGHRVVTFTVRNLGQREAHGLTPYFRTGQDADGYFDVYPDGPPTELNPRCIGKNVNDRAPCPDVLAPHDALQMQIDIPNGYVRELQSHEPNNAREQGVIVCVYSGGRNSCTNTGVVIPPVA
jgi:hypothetical protein